MAKTSRTGQGEEPEPPVTASDTGHARASGGESVVSGYRGPAPGASQGLWGRVHVSSTGDATAIGGGTAISGYVHSLTVQQRPPQEPAAWPHQVGVIPPAARSFQHRGESYRLRATAEGGGTTVLSQLLTGMGGVGKTQLAADYARAAWSDTSATGGLDVLVWIAASDRSSIVTGYAQAGIELCRADPNDPEQAARSFLSWLTPKAAAQPCRWLIVLDDVTDPDDVKGLWPPTSPHGRALVTTRRRDAALATDGRHTVEVGLFTPDEALAYLSTSLTGHDEPAADLMALAEALGHLPLALSQAAAYIVDAGETVAGYRNRLADRTTTLAALAPDVLPDDQALPLAAAWSLSIDRADTLRPVGLARPVLQLVSLLDGNGIPQDVLTSWPALIHLVVHRAGPEPARRRKWWPFKRQAPPSPTTVDTGEVIGALRVLHRLSLVEHTPATPHQAVRVHQLVQRATRDTLTPHEHHQAGRVAADALLAAWPEVEHDTDLSQILRANTTALTACAEDALYQPDTHEVLYRMGQSLGGSGQVIAARDHFQRLAETTCHLFGADHPDTLSARSSLAGWWGEAGDVLGATVACADLVEHTVRVLGEDHPNTLAARNNLAHARGEAGDVLGAVDAFADLLEHTVRVLGEDHPDTLKVRCNLARYQGEAGDALGAADAFADLLERAARVLGEDHPDTLAARAGLARNRGEAGDAQGAVDAFADLVERTARVLGEDDPHTLRARNNLVYYRAQAGDASGAAEAFANLLEHTVRVLGPDHPDTLRVRGNLVGVRGAAGDAPGAAAAFADVLAERTRVLGDDHPDTLATRNNLAYHRVAAGDASGAADTFAELLTDQLRVLGEGHPHTLITRNNLARCRVEAGDASGAARAYEQLLAARRRAWGEHHPETLAAWGSFAHWLGQAGDAVGAVTANERLLDHMVRALGGDHPHVSIVRNNLAHWRNEAEREPGTSDIDRS
ncbi:tetratricopeptide repeat protein [Streptomyces sp. MNP-20]|uniref:tetratricopeptide repeat protein n=1 Tax=Streptomyces sp. MNP-20 TaxID=2721165 RepID=UPI001557FAAE|nr:tetratricopeptide repeat protein [Streptomyces sp. MNP-20]